MDNKKAAEVLQKMPFWERFTDEEYTAMSRAIDVLNDDKKDIIYCRDCIHFHYSYLLHEFVCAMKVPDVVHDFYCRYALTEEMYKNA